MRTSIAVGFSCWRCRCRHSCAQNAWLKPTHEIVSARQAHVLVLPVVLDGAPPREGKGWSVSCARRSDGWAKLAFVGWKESRRLLSCRRRGTRFCGVLCTRYVYFRNGYPLRCLSNSLRIRRKTSPFQTGEAKVFKVMQQAREQAQDSIHSDNSIVALNVCPRCCLQCQGLENRMMTRKAFVGARFSE